VKLKPIALLVVALMAGIAAAYLVGTLGPPRRAGADDADYYCYQLRQGGVCMYARAECEARLAREAPADVRQRCEPKTNDPPSP
jgi:hypothetical protein